MASRPDTTESEPLSLHVPSQYRYLALVRDAVMEVCVRAGMSEFTCYQIEMAVDEACANIIEHSYQGESAPGSEQDDPGFLVEIHEQNDRLVFELLDWGKGFEFDEHPAQNLETYLANQDERGLGVYIISRFVDEVEYRRDAENGNRLLLTKHL